MARRSYKELEELALTTNANLKRVNIPVEYRIGASGTPKSYTIMTRSGGHLACSGKLSDCISFLNGINHLINHSIFKPQEPVTFSHGNGPRTTFSGAKFMPCNNSFNGNGMFECESDRGK